MLLEEGQEMRLPPLKAHYKQDISFRGDNPIFVLGKMNCDLSGVDCRCPRNGHNEGSMAFLFSTIPDSRTLTFIPHTKYKENFTIEIFKADFSA